MYMFQKSPSVIRPTLLENSMQFWRASPNYCLNVFITNNYFQHNSLKNSSEYWAEKLSFKSCSVYLYHKLVPQSCFNITTLKLLLVHLANLIKYPVNNTKT